MKCIQLGDGHVIFVCKSYPYGNYIHVINSSMSLSLFIHVNFNHGKFMNHVHFHPFWWNLSIHLMHLIHMVHCICIVNSIDVSFLVHEYSFIHMAKIFNIINFIYMCWFDSHGHFHYWGLFSSSCQLSSCNSIHYWFIHI